jgi:glycosyltransferase involved in cell wall biosynthesis
MTESTADTLDPAASREGGPVRRRLLVEAFATSPYRGSEPGGGWNVVRRLAAYHDVTVLCFPGYGRDAIEHYQRYLERHGPVPGLTMRWVEQPPLSRWLQREGVWFRAVYYRGYRAWEKAAWRVARELDAEQSFDLVHRLNMTGYREPGFLWQMDRPFVWGPVAGAVMMPRPFFKLLSWRDRGFYGLRNVLNAWQMRTKRRCRQAASRARKVWAVDDLNRSMLREHFGTESTLLLDSGCEPDERRRVRDAPSGRPLRVLWSGVHEGRKCLPILLHALRMLKREGHRFELTVLGEGPETAGWKKLASKLGVQGHIAWQGRVPQPEAVARMQDADVLVLTSLQEAATHVVMEALASGLPVICHDACGMGVAVNPSCGIKVPMIDPATSIEGFAAALRTLIETPEKLPELSAGAIGRADELSWDRKVMDFVAAYEQVLHAEAEA